MNRLANDLKSNTQFVFKMFYLFVKLNYYLLLQNINQAHIYHFSLSCAVCLFSFYFEIGTSILISKPSSTLSFFLNSTNIYNVMDGKCLIFILLILSKMLFLFPFYYTRRIGKTRNQQKSRLVYIWPFSHFSSSSLCSKGKSLKGCGSSQPF